MTEQRDRERTWLLTLRITLDMDDVKAVASLVEDRVNSGEWLDIAKVMLCRPYPSDAPAYRKDQSYDGR